jgi:ADP-dependent NAD(P)H-hydrate dehydratase / NAD(P)H-hydrate epimerase
LESPVLTSAQMRGAEKAAFARGVEVEALMDKAGVGVARAVTKFFPEPGTCIVFAGKGNNAGDALVAAQCLRRGGWRIEIRLAFQENDCSELMRKKLHALRGMAAATTPEWTDHVHHDPGVTILELSASLADSLTLSQDTVATKTFPCATSPVIVLDGLLGVGAKPPLREPVRAACRQINQLRQKRSAYAFAVDLPTGLDSDSGKADRDCVIADFTATIGFAKAGLVADDALNFVGRLEVVPLPDLVAEDQSKELIATPYSLAPLLPRRKFGAYKNQFGRVGVVAGSKGFIGAALMTTEGALRGGAGLVEVFVPEEIYEIVAAAAPMEAMVKPVESYRDLLKEKSDVWALGPGLGQLRGPEILELIEKTKQPMVVDADGLNILADKISTLTRCKGKRLLTPHPGEMNRLFPNKRESRMETATKFCKRFPVTLLLKGSRTIIGERKRALSYNTTGNPGMASGGMGDVLTGVCAGLAGQGLSLYDAARIGAWVCGRAAEIAIFHYGASEESLLARDVLDHLGEAFNELRNSTV